MADLLLLSNSTSHGRGYLDHAADEIADFLAGTGEVLFVPFALADHDAYADKARQRLGQLGLAVTSLHQVADPVNAVREARAIFVGGGNTFRLLRAVRERGILEAIRDGAGTSLRYLGASAGTNLACPTIATTNDMPIVEPGGHDALGLVPFQINPHYLDLKPDARHMGESREERIGEYLQEHTTPVVGLRESSWLRVQGPVVRLGGPHRARVFRSGIDAAEAEPGSDLAPMLLASTVHGPPDG